MKRNILPALLAFIIIQPLPLRSADDIVILALFRDKVIFNLDNQQYSLSPGESIDQRITLISADSREAVFRIDGHEQHFTLAGHIGSRFNKPDTAITVTIAPDSNGMYWVNGSINKHQTKFIIDTGASLISMNRHEAHRFGIDYKLDGKKAVSNTAAGPDTVYIVRLRAVSVGGIAFDNIMAAVHDSDYPEVILLGNSFLNKVSIRREGQLLRLSR